MSRHTSPHDEPWFSDPDQRWGGGPLNEPKRDEDAEYERYRQYRINNPEEFKEDEGVG